MNACRNPAAPPSRRTMRPPTASLPRLRPRSASSTVIGTTTKHTTMAVTLSMPSMESSMMPVVSIHMRSHKNSRNSAQLTIMSISAPRARRKNPSGSTSIATASPESTSSAVSIGVDMSTVNQVDADALSDARRAEWERLDALSRSRLDGAGVDELIVRYRAASADLAELKTSVGDSPQGSYVSSILARARLRLTGASDNVLTQIGRFFADQLPAALYRVRWTMLVIALAFIVVAVGIAAWVSSDPELVATLGPPDLLKQYAEESFTGYYTENPAAVFAGMVWTNNAWIAAQCVLFGVTGVWPLYVIMQNAVNVGISGAVMAAHDRADVMVLYILPHGMLEL